MPADNHPPAAPGSPLRYHLLGPLEVTRDGRVLDLGPPKQRATLAALLLAAGRVVSTDRLVQAVWGDDPPVRASANLQVYVSRLRSLLHGGDSSRLRRRNPGYALEAGWLDVTEFRRSTGQAGEHVRLQAWSAAVEQARTAIGLWRGPFLDDLGDEPWVRADALQLDEMYAQCTESWVTGLLGTGNIGEAITRSQTLIETHPLREHAWWLRMITLHRAGRSPDALDAFSGFARELDEQLGLEPGPALRELQTAILRHDPAIASWPLPPGRPGLTVPAVERPQPQENPVGGRPDAPGPGAMVGRGPELSTLDRLLHAIVAGEYRWALVTGSAGMGKTRLAVEASARARERGIRTIWTSCPDDDGVPAWWPLRTLVSHLGADPDEVFLPPPGADADTARFVAYERFSQLLEAGAAGRPLLVVIDDAQWLDTASIRALVYLAHTGRLSRLGIVLTARDRESRPEFDQALATIGREDFITHIPVPPLDAPSASALLRQVAGDTITAADAFALMRRIGGNPLLLTEYARLPEQDRRGGEIPLAARSLLERRLRRLPDGVVATLGAAGIIGDTFELDLLATVTGADILELADRLDAAVADSIIRPAASGVGYQFHHALIRDTVIATLTVLRRQTVHARIGQALAGRGNDPRTLIRRATHLSMAMPIVGPAVVVEAASAAAEAAEDRWDWDNAARQWESALTALNAKPDADPRAADDLIIARLAALARAGHTQRVWDVAVVALDDAIAAGRTATIGRLAPALVRSGGYWPFVGFGTDPGPVVQRLATALPAVAADPATRARVLTALAVAHSYGPGRDDTDAMSRDGVALAEQLNDDEVLADTLLGRLAFLGATRADVPEYAEILDRLHDLPHTAAPIDEVLERTHRIRLSCYRGDADGVAAQLAQGVAGADRLRLTGLRVHFRWVETMTAHWQGELDRADSLAATAYQAHSQLESGFAEIAYLAPRLLVWWDRGTLSQHAAETAGSPDPLLWAALAAAERGDLPTGRKLLAQQVGPAGPEFWYTLPNVALLAHAVADLGLTEAASALLDWLAPRTALFVTLSPFGVVGPAALSTGRLWALVGEGDRARADLAAAEAMSRASNHPAGVLRSRLAQLELDPPGEARAGAYRKLAGEAAALGLARLARQALQAG